MANIHAVVRYNAASPEDKSVWPMTIDAFHAKHAVLRIASQYVEKYAAGMTVGYLAKAKADGRWRVALATGQGWRPMHAANTSNGMDAHHALLAGPGFATAAAALRAAFPAGTWAS